MTEQERPEEAAAEESGRQEQPEQQADGQQGTQAADDLEPTIPDMAERSGPDRRTEADKLPPVPGADGGATEPHPGGSPV